MSKIDEGNTALLFWLGIAIVLTAIAVFVLISKSMHDNIKKLKDL